MHIDLSLSSLMLTMGKLFVLMAIGYGLFYWRQLDKKFVDDLSMLLVRVLFPALIVSRTVEHFSFREYDLWWLLPLVAIVFIAAGAALSLAVFPFLKKDFRSKKEFLSVCAFQNCGYLPMNLILFSFAGAFRDRLLIYVFLFIVGFNLVIWSLLPLFLSGRLKKDFSVKMFLNSPVLATVLSLVWVAIFGRGTLPPVVAGPLRQIGEAAFPMAMLTLGAYLACYRAYKPEPFVPVVLSLLVKLVLLPLVVLPLLFWIDMPAGYRFFLFLQSLMPSAVSIVVIGTYSGSDNKFISGTIFYSHVIALFTIPLWLALYGRIFN